MNKKQLIIALFIIVFLAYFFYNLGVNSRNDEVSRYKQMAEEQKQKQSEEKYIEDVVPLPGGIEISVLINKDTDKIEYWWHSSGWQPIENSKLNLQWAYDNRRTFRMFPKQ